MTRISRSRRGDGILQLLPNPLTRVDLTPLDGGRPTPPPSPPRPQPIPPGLTGPWWHRPVPGATIR